jgi:hypothetical protein
MKEFNKGFNKTANKRQDVFVSLNKKYAAS